MEAVPPPADRASDRSGGGTTQQSRASERGKRPARGLNQPLELPSDSASIKFYSGETHGGLELAEVWWSGEAHASADRASGAWADSWVSSRQRRRTRLPIVITYVRLARGWVPWTVAMESALLPGQWGLWAAFTMQSGEIIGWMRDGLVCGWFESDDDPDLRAERERRGGNELYELDRHGGVELRDGSGARRGGPRCANDARYVRRYQNALLRADGALVVRPFAEIRALRADMTDGERAACEITYSYDGPSGGSYWGRETHVGGEPSAGGSRKRPAGASPRRRPPRPAPALPEAVAPSATPPQPLPGGGAPPAGSAVPSHYHRWCHETGVDCPTCGNDWIHAWCDVCGATYCTRCAAHAMHRSPASSRPPPYGPMRAGPAAGAAPTGAD